MTTIPASYDTLVSQAQDVADIYFRFAVRSIDKEFGDGYARENPQLVGQMMSAMSTDFQTASFGKVVGELADRLGDIASALD